MAAAAPRRKPGNPGLGARKAITSRVPPPHWAVYAQEAEEAGIPLGDYVARILARAHKLPEPEWIEERQRKSRSDQAELPISA
jgi:hypothetical protein